MSNKTTVDVSSSYCLIAHLTTCVFPLLTLEIFANGLHNGIIYYPWQGGKWVKSCVHVWECALVAVVFRVNESKWWNHWSTQWPREERRWGLKEQHRVVLAKVKNHATVLRGLVLPTGKSDYIYAGTQVLLNTLFFALRLPLACSSLRPPLSLVPRPPEGQSRYKWLFAVQLPQYVCICSRLSLTACKTKKNDRKWALYTQIAPRNKKGSWIEMSKCH